LLYIYIVISRVCWLFYMTRSFSYCARW